MNNCDVLKKQILSRSIVYALIDNDKYSSFSIIDKCIHNAIQKLCYLEQSTLLNFIANVGNISHKYISYSVAYTSYNQLVEIKNIKINDIKDYQLYKMIVNTFVEAIFNKESDFYQNYLTQLCIQDKLKFNELIDICLNSNCDNNFDCHDNQNNINKYDNDYDNDDYDYDDDGYDSVG